MVQAAPADPWSTGQQKSSTSTAVCRTAKISATVCTSTTVEKSTAICWAISTAANQSATSAFSATTATVPTSTTISAPTATIPNPTAAISTPAAAIPAKSAATTTAISATKAQPSCFPN